MKDVRASGADDDFVAEGENDLVRLTLFADESLRPTQLTVDANVTGERVVNFLHLTFQNSVVNGDEVLTDEKVYVTETKGCPHFKNLGQRVGLSFRRYKPAEKTCPSSQQNVGGDGGGAKVSPPNYFCTSSNTTS